MILLLQTLLSLEQNICSEHNKREYLKTDIVRTENKQQTEKSKEFIDEKKTSRK